MSIGFDADGAWPTGSAEQAPGDPGRLSARPPSPLVAVAFYALLAALALGLVRAVLESAPSPGLHFVATVSTWGHAFVAGMGGVWVVLMLNVAFHVGGRGLALDDRGITVFRHGKTEWSLPWADYGGCQFVHSNMLADAFMPARRGWIAFDKAGRKVGRIPLMGPKLLRSPEGVIGPVAIYRTIALARILRGRGPFVFDSGTEKIDRHSAMEQSLFFVFCYMPLVATFLALIHPLADQVGTPFKPIQWEWFLSKMGLFCVPFGLLGIALTLLFIFIYGLWHERVWQDATPAFSDSSDALTDFLVVNGGRPRGREIALGHRYRTVDPAALRPVWKNDRQGAILAAVVFALVAVAFICAFIWGGDRTVSLVAACAAPPLAMGAGFAVAWALAIKRLEGDADLQIERDDAGLFLPTTEGAPRRLQVPYQFRGIWAKVFWPFLVCRDGKKTVVFDPRFLVEVEP